MSRLGPSPQRGTLGHACNDALVHDKSCYTKNRRSKTSSSRLGLGSRTPPLLHCHKSCRLNQCAACPDDSATRAASSLSPEREAGFSCSADNRRFRGVALYTALSVENDNQIRRRVGLGWRSCSASALDMRSTISAARSEANDDALIRAADGFGVPRWHCGIRRTRKLARAEPRCGDVADGQRVARMR